jgi:hypothetical protein
MNEGPPVRSGLDPTPGATRFKRVCLLLACALALALPAYIALRRPPQKPRVEIHIYGHFVTNDSVLISATATNIGPRLLLYWRNPMELRYQIGGSLTNFSHWAPSGTGFFHPGQALTDTFSVPRSATHCQVGAHFEYAGARETVAAYLLKKGWWNRLYPAADKLLRLLPTGTGKSAEFWSTEVQLQPE